MMMLVPVHLLSGFIIGFIAAGVQPAHRSGSASD
jgi:hypothetical protein